MERVRLVREMDAVERRFERRIEHMERGVFRRR